MRAINSAVVLLGRLTIFVRTVINLLMKYQEEALGESRLPNAGFSVPSESCRRLRHLVQRMRIHPFRTNTRHPEDFRRIHQFAIPICLLPYVVPVFCYLANNWEGVLPADGGVGQHAAIAENRC